MSKAMEDFHAKFHFWVENLRLQSINFWSLCSNCKKNYSYKNTLQLSMNIMMLYKIRTRAKHFLAFLSTKHIGFTGVSKKMTREVDSRK